MARGKGTKQAKAKGPSKKRSTKLPDLEVKKGKDAKGGADWTSVKSYSTWEANRRVFQYPENWLEP